GERALRPDIGWAADRAADRRPSLRGRAGAARGARFRAHLSGAASRARLTIAGARGAMRVTLLGTGCPQCDPDRLGPASLVQHERRQLLIDVGSGASQRLVSARSSGRALDAVLLTHLHSDHIVDLFQLVISSWHQGRDRPQRIYGPEGTRRFVEGLMALWRPELEQRIAHELRPSAAALEVDVTEIG